MTGHLAVQIGELLGEFPVRCHHLPESYEDPPYAYSWGLAAAKKHLQELGAPFLDMPAFDESEYPPLPEVEINPRDEYYVEPED